ncbi:MAG: methionine-R-sulfoxide reductase [Candidatus Moraniibacteriota bacterium]|nr:MAG: methionine-R-sulfoxide reductase [Candidatus Moranbacteria bacterium]
MPYNSLNKKEAEVILRQGTEAPFQGEYDRFFEDGTYICRQCNQPLYDAKAKFDAGCGWPAFDDHFPGAVVKIPDKDGRRIEIRCSQCHGHLGHVFTGERFTQRNTRHCVNSLSVRFIPRSTPLPPVLSS